MVVTKKYIIVFFINSLLFSYQTNQSINVITTNDIHGMLSEQKANFLNPNFPPTIIGGAGLNKYIEDIKNKSNKPLILDGGNFFQGHPLGIIDSGKTVIEWMNKIGYDALVPGREDFIFGYENLVSLSNIANFPFLASNLIYKDSQESVFKPYTIIEADNIKIGIIGLVQSNMKEFVLKKNLSSLEIIPEIRSLKQWIPIINEEEVDIIILLSSLGVPWEREKIYKNFEKKYLEVEDINNYKCNNSIELSFFVNNVDIIISGGENKGYNMPLYNGYSHTYVFQNYGNLTEFGHFKLNFNKNKIFSGYTSVVENKIAQTLYTDDFNYDLKEYNWINDRNEEAIKFIYDTSKNFEIKGDSYGFIYEENNDESNWEVPSFKIENKNNIITWNCEFFPTANDSTIDALVEIISDLDIDIIAFQEIKKRGWFDKMMRFLPQYSFVISKQSVFMDQAIIFKNELYELINSVEIFSEDDYNFAGRPPLRCDFIYKENNQKLSIIDLHMKCCDSGLLRRQRAAEMLYNYLEKEYLKNENNFIILGDWNDDLKDEEGEHCFSNFLNDEKYFFPTFNITYDLNQASYPKEPYVSLLDNILVMKSVLDHDDKYNIQTIRLDKYMGGFEIYESHSPAPILSLDSH